MSHEWDRGVLNESSWHGLESVEKLPSVDHMIKRGLECGAYPAEVLLTKCFTVDPVTMSTIDTGMTSVTARYQNHPTRSVGVVGDRYHECNPESWKSLLLAAERAGAKPTGCFSLRNGSTILGTFEIAADLNNGIKTNLIVSDCFDGKQNLMVGKTDIRVVCANTLSAYMRKDGVNAAKVRHTSTLAQKVEALTEAIEMMTLEAKEVSELYDTAKRFTLNRGSMDLLLNALFPIPTEEGRGKTRAENKRQEFLDACNLSINNEGPTLATFWNGATWIVDRTNDGKARSARGDADKLDSLLFGQRNKRIGAIETAIRTLVKAPDKMPLLIPAMCD